jgi:hypothetical protein
VTNRSRDYANLLPNGSGENSAQAFFPSIGLPAELRSFSVSQSSKYVEIRSGELFQLGMEMEDEKVANRPTRVRSRLYYRGRRSPRREVGTHHFHKLLARFLNQ